MFFFQGQRCENTSGRWTEVPAYFYLKDQPAFERKYQSLMNKPHQIN